MKKSEGSDAGAGTAQPVIRREKTGADADSSKKIDRRKKYTLSVIRQSLLDIMRNCPISKITVTDVCTAADINRGTFYAHYRDPYDVLFQMQDELYQTVERSVSAALNQNSRSSALIEIMKSISDNRDLCAVLFSEYGDRNFMDRILRIAHDTSMAQWKSSVPGANEKMLELAYVYIANGSAGVLKQWIQDGMTLTVEQTASFINIISETGLRGLADVRHKN